jgi:hypothetical protein
MLMSAEKDESWESLKAAIGGALINCQGAERLIVVCLSYLFPNDEPVPSIETLQRKMLGKLIGELRKRVEPGDERFETLLSDFLEHRNTLVHDLGRIKGHDDFSTPEGIAAVKDFASKTTYEAGLVSMILISLIDSWTEHIGIREKLRAEKPDIWNSDILVKLQKAVEDSRSRSGLRQNSTRFILRSQLGDRKAID